MPDRLGAQSRGAVSGLVDGPDNLVVKSPGEI